MFKRDGKERLDAYAPALFKEKMRQAEELAKSRQILLLEDLDEGESIHFIYGPVPLGPGDLRVCFQAVWFGTISHEWPIDSDVLPPSMMTEHPKIGRMLMWIFDTYEEGADFLSEMWDLCPPQPDIQ